MAALGLRCCLWAFSSCGRQGLLLVMASPAVALGHVGSSSCRSQAHVGSSQSRNQTYIPCIGKQILNHWTTKEAPTSIFYLFIYFLKAQLYLFILFFFIFLILIFLLVGGLLLYNIVVGFVIH